MSTVLLCPHWGLSPAPKTGTCPPLHSSCMAQPGWCFRSGIKCTVPQVHWALTHQMCLSLKTSSKGLGVWAGLAISPLWSNKQRRKPLGWSEDEPGHKSSMEFRQYQQLKHYGAAVQQLWCRRPRTKTGMCIMVPGSLRAMVLFPGSPACT